MTRDTEGYQLRPFPKIRRAYVDVLREGHRRHTIHGLVEVDVTDARAAIRAPAAAGGPRLSFTGFIVACTPKPVDEDRLMHARRRHQSLTISVDHDIIDGAPAERFVERLRQLIESADGLDG